MSIIEKLNATLFVELGLFIFLFIVLSKIFFKPFQELFEIRYKKTIEDKAAAESMVTTAETKLNEYQARLKSAREKARQHIEEIVQTAQKKEAELFSSARSEAKKVTQETMTMVQKEKEMLSAQLKTEVETSAKQIAERLLA